MKRSSSWAAPRPQLAVERYRTHAAGYDASARRTMPLRQRTIARLQLQRGETVVDVACGTGLSFSLLQQALGPEGRIMGVELSPDMLAVARRRVADACWHNVTLIEAAAEDAALPFEWDAALFNYTHDVLRSPRGLANLFARARPGARVAVAGMKLASPWLFPLNVFALAKARPYMTTFEGLSQPWSLIQAYLEEFVWQPTQFGIGFIGHGRVRIPTAGDSTVHQP